MPLRVKTFIGIMLVAGGVCAHWASATPTHEWLRFGVYIVVILLTSAMKVPMPRGDGTLSANFPFILLGIVQLSPLEAICLAAISVFAQCRIRVIKTFTLVQIAFNVANAVVATAGAYFVLRLASHWINEPVPALCLAATAYYLANTSCVALVIGWSSGESPAKLWRREFPWYLPFYIAGGIVASVVNLISQKFGFITSLLLIPVGYAIFHAYRAQTTMLRDRQRHLTEMEALHLRTIEGLAMAIEAKDQDTHNHLLRVRVYVGEIGREMKLDELQMQALLTAAFLHDVGKLAVPEHIVNKPGKLTHEEFEKMKIHPAVGADILERMRFPYPVAPIVRSHHEAWDGSGYPDGLKGDAIPIGARILTVVDCFDAMISDRPYRKAMPLEKVIGIIRMDAGKHFDPDVVAVFERIYLDMEAKAVAARGEIQPLDLTSPLWCATAPGIGYAREDTESVESSGLAIMPLPASFLAAEERPANDSLRLIAAASQEAQTLFEMSQVLGNSLSPNETISVMSSRLKLLIPFDSFAVYLKVDDALHPQYIDGDGAAWLSKTPLEVGKGLSGRVAQSGKPMLNGNAGAEPNYRGDINMKGAIVSALSVPLFNLYAQVFGVLTVYSSKQEPFSREHLRILLAVETKFALSLQNALRFSNTEKAASIDFVTQLPNVRQFFIGMEKHLSVTPKKNEQLAVIVCDLNSFKAVNDQQGHLAGNRFLRCVSKQFCKVCRAGGMVARMGGDEFVFILPNWNQASRSSELSAIRRAVESASRDQELDGEVTVSIGVALYPADGATAEELLAVADRRMYLEKRLHYESLGVFTESSSSNAIPVA